MYGIYPSGYGSTGSRDRRSLHEAIPRRSVSSQVPSSRGYENGSSYSADPYGRHPVPKSASKYHGTSSSRTRSKSPKKQSQHNKQHQARSPSPRSTKKRNRSRSKSGSRSKRSRSPASSPPHKASSSASSQSRKSSTYAQSVHSSGGAAGSSSRALPSASLGAELQKVLGEKRKQPTPVNIASEPMRKSIKSESEMIVSPAKESPPDFSKKDEKYSTSKICKTMTLPPLPLPDVDDNEEMDTAGENSQKGSPL